MAEGTYEYECERAELLGIDKPDYDEFMQQKRVQEAKAVEEKEVDVENLKTAEDQDEALNNIAGGLSELNALLNVTQKKLNNFKASCGSLTNLLKTKIGRRDSTASCSSQDNAEEAAGRAVLDQRSISVDEGEIETPRKSDLSKALDNHVDKLDLLIEKTENCELSMSHQNKQMKKFLQ